MVGKKLRCHKISKPEGFFKSPNTLCCYQVLEIKISNNFFSQNINLYDRCDRICGSSAFKRYIIFKQNPFSNYVYDSYIQKPR